MPRRNPDEAVALLAIGRRASAQEGVVTYRQSREEGLSVGAIRRLVDSGRWRRLHRGVFHVGSGEPGPRGRMWAAHLALGPGSVVAGAAAGHYWGLIDGELHADVPLLMLVPEQAHMRTSGVRIRRVRDPHVCAHPARRPPVLSVEHTVLDLVGSAVTEALAVEIVLRACRLRLTTPDRLLAVVHEQPRQRRRALVQTLCADVAAGVTSPLERHYRTAVARAHGLPPGRGQALARVGARTAYRDVIYDEQGVLVELDGRLGHEDESAVLRDQDRDNVAVLTGLATLRFGWLAVFASPCLVASQVVQLLRTRGWTGQGQRCGPSCPVGSDQPGAVVLHYRQQGTRFAGTPSGIAAGPRRDPVLSLVRDPSGTPSRIPT